MSFLFTANSAHFFSIYNTLPGERGIQQGTLLQAEGKLQQKGILDKFGFYRSPTAFGPEETDCPDSNVEISEGLSAKPFRIQLK